MTVECKIKALESGWSKFYISNMKTACEFEFSYLVNPIEELIFILYQLSINSLKSEYRVVFPEEPGQNVLYINCKNDADIIIKVTSSSEWEKISNAYKRQNEERIVYLDENENRQNFIRLVLKAIYDYINLGSSMNKLDHEKILTQLAHFGLL